MRFAQLPDYPIIQLPDVMSGEVMELSEVVLVLTTIGEEAADELARTLVAERLAACVNVQASMRSTYRWKGQIECEPERQVVIKTTRSRLDALEKRLRALHPYELPEFVVLDAQASDAYGSWVADETRPV
jgi:periplasmic divalent cation tolerance protein